jgi:hypothetical protein
MTNHKNAKRFNRDGREVPNEGPLADGDYIRVPMSMMDSAHAQHLEDKTLPIDDTSLVRHSRGFIGATPVVDTTEFSNAAEASYAERKQRLSQAWLYQQPKPAAPPLAKKDEATTTPATESLLQARDERLTEAWRNPPAMLPVSSTATDTSKPVNIDPAKVTAADVDAAIERRNARLESAWKVPA